MSGGPAARARVLLVDDDDRLNALLTEYLSQFGFTVTAEIRPQSALRALRADPPDIVVLDVMLPEIDGLTLCRTIRASTRVPIVMLTARGDVSDRIVGLEMGADDYISKPFEPRELVARLQAVLRRGSHAHDDVLKAGGVELNSNSRSASLDGRPLSLTTAEFELLTLLVRNRGRVLSRERILDAMRGIDWDAYDRSVDVLVSRLRQKLGDRPARAKYIKTVRGIGYCFAGSARD